MRKKILTYTILGIISFVLLLFGCYYLLMRAWQGEFFKYDNGVTIEIYNSSKQDITNLNFFFSFDSNYTVQQELGTINKLEPGETTSLYSSHINGKGSDRSLYLQYPLSKTETHVESLSYLPAYRPSKAVVILEVTGTDDKGKLLFRVKGFEDILGPYEFDLTSN